MKPVFISFLYSNAILKMVKSGYNRNQTIEALLILFYTQILLYNITNDNLSIFERSSFYVFALFSELYTFSVAFLQREAAWVVCYITSIT